MVTPLRTIENYVPATGELIFRGMTREGIVLNGPSNVTIENYVGAPVGMSWAMHKRWMASTMREEVHWSRGEMPRLRER